MAVAKAPDWRQARGVGLVVRDTGQAGSAGRGRWGVARRTTDGI